MTKEKTKSITIGEVRVAYQHILSPMSHKGTKEEKYSVTLLVPKDDLDLKNRIDAAIEEAVELGVSSKWNGVKPVNLSMPIHDGDGLRPNGEFFGEEFKNNFVMTANSNFKPEIVDRELQPLMNEKEIYNGVFVYASVNFFAYANSGRRGIGCGLGPVMKYRDGNRLGGRVTASQAFAGIPKVSDSH